MPHQDATYAIRVKLKGTRRWKLLGKDNKTCRRRANAKLFGIAESAQELINRFNSGRIDAKMVCIHPGHGDNYN
jgi:hypothetical protein